MTVSEVNINYLLIHRKFALQFQVANKSVALCFIHASCLSLCFIHGDMLIHISNPTLRFYHHISCNCKINEGVWYYTASFWPKQAAWKVSPKHSNRCESCVNIASRAIVAQQIGSFPLLNHVEMTMSGKLNLKRIHRHEKTLAKIMKSIVVIWLIFYYLLLWMQSAAWFHLNIHWVNESFTGNSELHKKLTSYHWRTLLS